MEHIVLAVFVFSVSTALLIEETQAYQPIQPLFDNLRNSVNAGQASTLLSSSKENNRLSDIDVSLEKQTAELEDIKDSLETLANGVDASFRVPKFPKLMALSAVEEAVRQALVGTGVSSEELEEIVEREMRKMQSRLIPYGKRGRSRFSVQTRFAPFGTKLVPNRKLENGGATLLRYGRSLQNL